MKKILFLIFIFFYSTSSIFSQYQSFIWLVGNQKIDFTQSSDLTNDFPNIEPSIFNITSNNTIASNSNYILAHTNENTYNVSGSDIYTFNPLSENQPACFQLDTITESTLIFKGFFLENNGTDYTLYKYEDLYSSIPDNVTTGLCSKMAVYKNIDYTKVVSHKLNSDEFMIYDAFNYNTTYQAIGNTYGGIGTGYDTGFMKFSPNGDYLVVTSPGANEIVIYSFDQATNAITNQIYLENSSGIAYNAIEFSALFDNLYVADGNNIYQIDFSDNTNVIVENIGYSANTIKNMQLAPDGKIYVAKEGDDWLGVIFNPEIKGSDCIYENEGIYAPGNNGHLPAFPANYFIDIPIIDWTNNTNPGEPIRAGDEINFFLSYIYSPVDIFWDFGDGSTSSISANLIYTYYEPGLYELTTYIKFWEAEHAIWDSVKITKKVNVHPTPTSSTVTDIKETFNWIIGNKTISFNQQDNLNPNFPIVLDNYYNIVTSNNISCSDDYGEIISFTSQNNIYFPLTTGGSNISISGNSSDYQPFQYFAENNAFDGIDFDFLFLGNDGTSGDLTIVSGNYNGAEFIQNTNNVISSNVASKMATYTYNGYKKVVVHELGTNKFRMHYDITNPAIFQEQAEGAFYGTTINDDYADGYMKFSPDGNLLAVSSPSMNDLRVYRYTQDNDQIYYEHFADFTSGFSYNALEFASALPDVGEYMLYVADDYNIVQLNLSLNPSYTVVGTSTNKITNMQLGPDGKIYVIKENDDDIGIIYNPEIKYDCVYEDEALNIGYNHNASLPSYSADIFQNAPVIYWENSNNPDTVVFQNDLINFEILNNPPYLTQWDFGDGYIVDATNTVEHTYTDAGTYEIKVKLLFDDVNDFRPWDSVMIKKYIVVHSDVNPNVEITASDSTLCSYTTPTTLSIDVDDALYQIFWSSPNDEFYPNTNTIQAYTPGIYEVTVYDQSGTNLIGFDDIFIDMEHCNNLEVNIRAYNSLSCDNSEETSLVADIADIGNICPIDDFADFYYVWDMGNGVTFEDTGLDSINYTYPVGGSYSVSLYLFDNFGCTHTIRERVKTITHQRDTLFVELYNNTLDDIVVDFRQYPAILTNYLRNSRFYLNLDETIYPYNELKRNITVPVSMKKTLESAGDLALFANIAYKGNFSISLISPTGQEYNVTDIYNDTLDYILGYPALNFDNNQKSISKIFMFNANGFPIEDIDDSKILNWYYSPDEEFVLDKSYYTPTEVYNFNDSVEIVGDSIVGDWIFKFYGEGDYGYIKSVGLIFPNKYFYKKMMPDSMTCYDQFGIKYKLQDSSITIKNSGVEQYELDCSLYYGETNCSIDKKIIVNTPIIANAFTPNGDGLNDYWEPIEDEINAYIVIFDKNGRILASYYNNEKPEGWDGTYNGNKLPTDSYWYIISLSEDYQIKGTITIIN